MCGICGDVSLVRGIRADRPILEGMANSLRHRGPDDDGYYFDDYAALGMRRLSIIDIAGSRQPLSNEDRSIWLIFNGEIYNFQSLRAKLQKKGHRFASSGDAEVVIHAYEEYGDRCLDQLNGMFAFALWDRARRRLVVARDRIGIKPLFFYSRGDRLIFASEIKALLKHPKIKPDIDPRSLDMFLSLEYIPSSRTILRDVHKLPPGHVLVLERENITVRPYWQISTIDLPKEETSCVERLDELIASAVQLRLISDVPLGAFLSGGIDSSTVVSYMSSSGVNPLRTFSIGFEEAGYNELPFARMVAEQFSASHTEEFLRPEIQTLAQSLVTHFDEPFADFSIFPTFLISELAAQDVKVALSGDGGDELFGGYDTYTADRLDRYYRRIPWVIRSEIISDLAGRLRPRPQKKGIINKLKRFVEGADQPEQLQHARWMLFLSRRDRSALYQRDFHASLNGDSTSEEYGRQFSNAPFSTALANQQYVDVKTYLAEDILAKVDRMSMANSLEVRVPLLDHRVVEFALNLPDRLKVRGLQRKVILHNLMKDRLPAAVLRRGKQGFSIPMKLWLRGPLRSMMLDILSANEIASLGYFHWKYIEKLMREHLEGTRDHSHILWALMVFEMWRRDMVQRSSLATEGSGITIDRTLRGSDEPLGRVSLG